MSDFIYLIWSHKHDMWWGPDHAGYTPHLTEAGRYTFEEAAEIVVPVYPPGTNVAVDERGADRWAEWVQEQRAERQSA